MFRGAVAPLSFILSGTATQGPHTGPASGWPSPPGDRREEGVNPSDKIFVAGHRGMVGSSILRLLKNCGYDAIATRGRDELDLRESRLVEDFFRDETPDYVFLAAARVGGILANMQNPAEFLFDNLLIQANVIQQSRLNGVKKLCFLGSSCIYPKDCPQPMKEEHLFGGRLEPTNEGYALAKLTGIKMLEYCHRQYGFQSICPIPCNLYGTNDSYDLQHSHVLSALIRKFVDAVDDGDTLVVVWGTGAARREFLHVDDLARALLVLMDARTSPEIINVGSGSDISIRQLAEMVASIVGFRGRIEWDPSKPDGMPLKCMDVSRMQEYGFQPAIGLEEGILRTVSEYRALKRESLPANSE